MPPSLICGCVQAFMREPRALPPGYIDFPCVVYSGAGRDMGLMADRSYVVA